MKLSFLLPLAGVIVLRSRKTAVGTRSGSSSIESASSSVKVDGTASPTFYLRLPRGMGEAMLCDVDGDVFLLERSRSVGSFDWDGERVGESIAKYYRVLAAHHNELIQEGAIRVEGETGVLTRDVPMSSASKAASICLGRSENGRRCWKTREGFKYGEWEDC